MLHLNPKTIAAVKKEIETARSGDSPMSCDDAWRAGQHVDLDAYRTLWREAEAADKAKAKAPAPAGETKIPPAK